MPSRLIAVGGNRAMIMGNPPHDSPWHSRYHVMTSFGAGILDRPSSASADCCDVWMRTSKAPRHIGAGGPSVPTITGGHCCHHRGRAVRRGAPASASSEGKAQLEDGRPGAWLLLRARSRRSTASLPQVWMAWSLSSMTIGIGRDSRQWSVHQRRSTRKPV